MAISNKTRPSYTRVKVEVDLLGDFPKRTNIEIKKENKSNYCKVDSNKIGLSTKLLQELEAIRTQWEVITCVSFRVLSKGGRNWQVGGGKQGTHWYGDCKKFIKIRVGL